MEIYWERVILIVVAIVLMFVCWMGDRESKRIDALEARMNARDATLDDGR